MSGPGYHHNQPGETHRRPSSNSPPRRAYDSTSYGPYTRSVRAERPHSSSEGRPRAPAADLFQQAYSSPHGRFLNAPPAYSNPFANEPGMAGRATADQTHTNARMVPSFDPPSAAPQPRSRSSDWRLGGPVPSSLPTPSSPVLGGPAQRPSSAASGATSSHLLNERRPKSREMNGPGEALFPFSGSPPHPTRTDIIDDRPEIHAPQPSRLKPWKDILATRSDMLGLDKPPPRLPQRPPVPRKDSPHQGA